MTGLTASSENQLLTPTTVGRADMMFPYKQPSRGGVFISCTSLRMISHWDEMDASHVAKRLPWQSWLARSSFQGQQSRHELGEQRHRGVAVASSQSV